MGKYYLIFYASCLESDLSEMKFEVRCTCDEVVIYMTSSEASILDALHCMLHHTEHCMHIIPSRKIFVPRRFEETRKGDYKIVSVCLAVHPSARLSGFCESYISATAAPIHTNSGLIEASP